jgi:hypothetical protein
VNKKGGNSVEAFVEILDYAGDNDFHGFVTRNGMGRTLFVFFGHQVLNKDLKSG